MLAMLLAYDANGDVVATLDHLVATDEGGRVIGLVDFEAHELAGGRLRDVWENDRAVGSATWPEWIGTGAYDFRVELDANPGQARARIARLVHKGSGHVRDRRDIDRRIAERVVAANGKPADIRDIVGGPDRPLLLDPEGRNRERGVAKPRTILPVIRRRDR